MTLTRECRDRETFPRWLSSHMMMHRRTGLTAKEGRLTSIPIKIELINIYEIQADDSDTIDKNSVKDPELLLICFLILKLMFMSINEISL